MNYLLNGSMLLILGSSCTASLAEGGGHGGDAFRATAEKYERKSEKYRAKGMHDIAGLYARQAEIKRHAAKLGDADRWADIDWSEYHANETRIDEQLQHEKKQHSKTFHDENRAGDEFREAARNYEKKSAMYSAMGMIDVAELYSRQAKIKRAAAKLGDQGRWKDIDWKEYHENEALIKQEPAKQKKTHHKQSY